MIRGEVKIESLIGKTFDVVEVTGEGLVLKSGRKKYVMTTLADCCNYGDLTDIAGDLADLIGTPIVRAEEPSNDDEIMPMQDEIDNAQESETWTFVILGTKRGTVTFRWYGTSKGCYSEDVYLYEVKP